jgi:hypothetical protein
MNDPYAYLHEQEECTSPSGSVMETSYASSDDGAGGLSPWSGFSSIARQVAHTINKSAKSLMNELAELEIEARERSTSYDSSTGSEPTGSRSKAENRNHHSRHQQQQKTTILPLPWEICFQETDANLKISIEQKEDEPLKEKIMALSKDESVFTGPFNEKNSNEDESIFTLDDSRVMLIRRLLEIDTNLGYIHARVSGRSTMKEKIFWMNYFFHCEKLREHREKEINEQSLKRALHDDELDAELVGRPPASCTGFYPRTGKLSLNASSSTDSGNGGVICASGVNGGYFRGASRGSFEDNRVVPALPHMECTDGFVMVDEDVY